MSTDASQAQVDGRQQPDADGPAPDHGLALAVRRETSSGRVFAAALVALVVTLLCVYALLESTLQAIGQPAWIIDPETASRFVAGLPGGANAGVLGLLGVVVAVVGVGFVLLAVLPGRPGRRVLPSQRIAVVLDDEVLASALARRARTAATVRPEQVTVVVSHGEAIVNVRPTSGVPVRAEDVLAAVEDELKRLRPEPYPLLRVRVAGTGVIGA
ncbi:DUF6286 domain-containing protein [Sinomonas sp. ASV322]|uniref:DUF6286 domain-containing protein n=1 Tax=Sinomonas sp. ASV322 TaxID=3041920 RepID=UPI0027DC66D3|nr:DUF6286 domain-containing protein [Sinomonas sp. ASV322]MDQ4501241.1 DUF6286 domain-containing protein [Sinomonas sp. ASV322]